jgi:hypothetical protein
VLGVASRRKRLPRRCHYSSQEPDGLFFPSAPSSPRPGAGASALAGLERWMVAPFRDQLAEGFSGVRCVVVVPLPPGGHVHLQEVHEKLPHLVGSGIVPAFEFVRQLATERMTDRTSGHRAQPDLFGGLPCWDPSGGNCGHGYLELDQRSSGICYHCVRFNPERDAMQDCRCPGMSFYLSEILSSGLPDI